MATQRDRKRGNIQRKVITSILLVGTIPGILVVILTYLSGINALKNSIGANFQEIANFLKEYQRQRMLEYGSILITDRKGGIIVATNRPSDYNQGEKIWWHTTFYQGKRRDFISGIEYDEEAQTYSVAIAVPIYDQDNKEVIGVLKTIHDVKR